MRLRLIPLLIASTTLLAGQAGAEGAHVRPVTDYVKANVVQWLSDPALISAIKAQNSAHAALTADAVEALDQQWRVETDADAGDRPLIDKTLNNPLSAFLKQKQESSDGMISEVFVMDDKGLNVGQSDVTSDYWQGDEAKFQKSFGAGAGAVFVDDAEKDESSQVLQTQVSLTLTDEKGAPIGAITLGINLDQI